MYSYSFGLGYLRFTILTALYALVGSIRLLRKLLKLSRTEHYLGWFFQRWKPCEYVIVPHITSTHSQLFLVNTVLCCFQVKPLFPRQLHFTFHFLPEQQALPLFPRSCLLCRSDFPRNNKWTITVSLRMQICRYCYRISLMYLCISCVCVFRSLPKQP